MRPIKRGAHLGARPGKGRCGGERADQIPAASRLSAVSAPQEACDGADIIVTTTPSEQPILKAEWLRPGQHVTAMGSDSEHKNEIEPAVLTRVDSMSPTALRRRDASANCITPSQAGLIAPDRAFAESSARSSPAQIPGRESRDAITLCDLTGTGVQDTAIATLARRRAVEAGAGTEPSIRKNQPEARRERTQSELQPSGICRAPRQDAQGHGGAGHRPADRHRPSNMHWLTGYDGWSFYVHQAVLVPPDGEPVWYGRGQDANGAKRTAYLAHDNIVGYPDHYVQSTERHPMDYLSAGHRRARLGQAHHRRRDGQLLVLGRRLRHRCSKHLPNARFVDATGAGELAARGQEPDRDRLHAQGRAASSRRCTQRIVDKVEPGMRKMRPRRRDLRRRHPRRRRIRRRLSGDRAAAALGRGRLGAAPDLGRQADASGRGHLLRDRRLLQPLPLPAVAHGLPRQADAGVPRRREGDAGRHGGGPRRRKARQHLRGHRQRLLRRARSATASSRTTAPAIRSASPIRRTGASAP